MWFTGTWGCLTFSFTWMHTTGVPFILLCFNSILFVIPSWDQSGSKHLKNTWLSTQCGYRQTQPKANKGKTVQLCKSHSFNITWEELFYYNKSCYFSVLQLQHCQIVPAHSVFMSKGCLQGSDCTQEWNPENIQTNTGVGEKVQNNLESVTMISLICKTCSHSNIEKIPGL